VSKIKILVSIPNLGWIHKLVSFATDRLLIDPRYHTHLIRPTHIPYENNLAHILRDFVNGDEDYWLNIDADNPPVNSPYDLIEFDKDLIGLPTPVWHNTDNGERPIYWNAYKYNPEKKGYNEWPTKKGLQCVDAIGSGCFIMAKRVAKAIKNVRAFRRIYNRDGTVEMGPDFYMCKVVKELGFEIYAHYDYACDHFNELALNEIIRAALRKDSWQ